MSWRDSNPQSQKKPAALYPHLRPLSYENMGDFSWEILRKLSILVVVLLLVVAMVMSGAGGIRRNFGQICRGRVNWCRMITSGMFL
jgi:hypothetical protein